MSSESLDLPEEVQPLITKHILLLAGRILDALKDKHNMDIRTVTNSLGTKHPFSQNLKDIDTIVRQSSSELAYKGTPDIRLDSDIPHKGYVDQEIRKVENIRVLAEDILFFFLYF